MTKLRMQTVLVAVSVAVPAMAGPTVPDARSRLLTTQLNTPIAMASTPADPDFIYVCERAGTVRRVHTQTGAVGAAPFLDISGTVSLDVDNGLLGLAFAPDFATSGHFYINYVNLANDIVLERHTAVPGAESATPGSAFIIWRYNRPLGHNGGWIGFSPLDNLLTITSGDGGLGGVPDFANRAQTIVDQKMGKILRIDPTGDDFPADPDRNYRIPLTNPFVGITGDDEIWAYGVRNPWKGSFDRLTGDFHFGDVGMDSREEINFEPAGSPGGLNYGWPCMEGFLCTGAGTCTCNDPGLTMPAIDFPHPTARSITGGYVYRGAAIPAFQGRYFFADFLANRIWSFVTQPDGSAGDLRDHTVEFTPPGGTNPIRFIATFGEDAAGELYVADIFQNRLYKIQPFPCLPEIDRSPASATVPANSMLTLSVLAVGQAPLEYQWRRNGIDLVDGGRISGAQTQSLTISNIAPADGGDYDVVVTSTCGSTTSAAAEISLLFCPSADINDSGTLSVQDIFDFLALYFSNAPAADFNDSGNISVQDIFDFLASYFTGCV